MTCACDNPSIWDCPTTMQGIVMGATQMLTQGFYNCTDLQNRDNASIMRHGLPNGLQISSYGAINLLAPTEKASSRLSGKIVWKSNPTGLAATLFLKSCRGNNSNSSSNIALGVIYLTPHMCPRYLSQMDCKTVCAFFAAPQGLCMPHNSQPKSLPPSNLLSEG